MELLCKRVSRPEYHLHQPGRWFCGAERHEVGAKPSTRKDPPENSNIAMNMFSCKFKCGELYCSHVA